MTDNTNKGQIEADKAHEETRLYYGGNKLIKLNIGGILFTTTEATLVAQGENFFTPLLRGEIPTLKDDNGAYFIDRNGRYFEPILDYLRHGNVTLQPNMQLDVLLEEANFYLIDLVPGFCKINEGLYTSQNWILFLERDLEHPWLFGITGVLQERITRTNSAQEKKKNLYKRSV